MQVGGSAAVAVLQDNMPCFYVLSPSAWHAMQGADRLPGVPKAEAVTVFSARPVQARHESNRYDSFDWLTKQLIQFETQRMERGDLSRAAVGILRNRLQAHVMPFFKDRPPSTVDASVLEGFIQRLTDAKLSTTTMSQYLVVVRKLLKLAVRHKLLNEVPEMPQVRVVHLY